MDGLEIKQITTISDSFIQDINKLIDEGKVWDAEEGHKFVNNTDCILFVAYFNHQPAGFVSGYRLQRFDKRKAEVLLYEIGVNEEFRQKGIAKQLIIRLREWAKEKEADEVWVLTNKSNILAMKLYTSAGGNQDNSDDQMFTFKL